VKRRELIRHLTAHACVLIREGSDHSCGAIRFQIGAPQYPGTLRSTNFLLGKFVAIWASPCLKQIFPVARSRVACPAVALAKEDALFALRNMESTAITTRGV